MSTFTKERTRILNHDPEGIDFSNPEVTLKTSGELPKIDWDNPPRVKLTGFGDWDVNEEAYTNSGIQIDDKNKMITVTWVGGNPPKKDTDKLAEHLHRVHGDDYFIITDVSKTGRNKNWKPDVSKQGNLSSSTKKEIKRLDNEMKHLHSTIRVVQDYLQVIIDNFKRKNGKESFNHIIDGFREADNKATAANKKYQDNKE